LPTWAESPRLPMRRASRLRTRVPVGTAARRRMRAGGPRARGRPAATVEQWADIRSAVLARARWRCQACGACTRLELHHILKRAQGGSDFDLDLLVALCRRCHERTDWSYSQGRLAVRTLAAGRFAFAIVRGPDKWRAEAITHWESDRSESRTSPAQAK